MSSASRPSPRLWPAGGSSTVLCRVLTCTGLLALAALVFGLIKLISDEIVQLDELRHEKRQFQLGGALGGDREQPVLAMVSVANAAGPAHQNDLIATSTVDAAAQETLQPGVVPDRLDGIHQQPAVTAKVHVDIAATVLPFSEPHTASNLPTTTSFEGRVKETGGQIHEQSQDSGPLRDLPLLDVVSSIVDRLPYANTAPAGNLPVATQGVPQVAGSATTLSILGVPGPVPSNPADILPSVLPSTARQLSNTPAGNGANDDGQGYWSQASISNGVNHPVPNSQQVSYSPPSSGQQSAGNTLPDDMSPPSPADSLNQSPRQQPVTPARPVPPVRGTCQAPGSGSGAGNAQVSLNSPNPGDGRVQGYGAEPAVSGGIAPGEPSPPKNSPQSNGNPAPAYGPDPMAGSAAPSMLGWNYLGCFHDAISRTLVGAFPQDYVLGTVSNELCVSHCSSRGYSFAGTEDGQECWCGTALRTDATRLPENYCELPCTGDPGTTCGGDWAIRIYYCPRRAPLPPIPEYRSVNKRSLRGEADTKHEDTPPKVAGGPSLKDKGGSQLTRQHTLRSRVPGGHHDTWHGDEFQEHLT